MNFHAPRIVLLLVALAWPRFANGQPNVKYLYPAGGEIGTSVDVKVDGELAKWPVGVWVHQSGLVVKPSSVEDDERRLNIEITPAAKPAVYWLRVFDSTGSSAPKPFIVGWLPEVLEEESNNSIKDAQTLREQTKDPAALIVNGRLQQRGDVDVYAIHVAKGQKLVADIDAHQPLGSAVDTVLQILSPDGFVTSQVDDHLQLDPRLVYNIPKDGIWYIRVFGFPATPTSRIQFAGDPAFVYRLTISTGPVVDHAMPLAAHKTQATDFQLFGWNLPPSLRQLTLTPRAERDRLLLRADGLTRSIDVPLVTDALIVEREPCSVAEPMAIELPATITGRIQPRGDRDAFKFAIERDQTVVATLESRTLGYPLDGVIELMDANGKQLAKNDDAGGSRDAALTYRMGVDGPLRLAVSDLHGNGGESFVYRLRINHAAPAYALSIANHQQILRAGEKSELAVSIERSHGHNKSISLSVEGLPAGISVADAQSHADGDSAKQVKLVFDVEPSAAVASVPIRIVGHDGQAKRHAKMFGGKLDTLWVTVTAGDED